MEQRSVSRFGYAARRKPVTRVSGKKRRSMAPGRVPIDLVVAIDPHDGSRPALYRGLTEPQYQFDIGAL